MNLDTHHYFFIGRAALLLTLLLAVAGTPAMATDHIIHVNHAAADSANDGSSWSDAYTDLQAALATAVAGSEIWVASGVYMPTDNASNRAATFHLADGVAIYGGFAGDETALDQRDWLTHITVLSGDIDDNDTTDANGVVVDADDIVGSNSFHVVTGSGTDATAILDGFIITAGLANGDFLTPCGQVCGAGMYNDSGNPTLANLGFSGNRADIDGGGMYNVYSSSPTLTNVSFSGNEASNNTGGGMANWHESSPTLTRVSFSSNRAPIGGGMFNNNNSSPTLTNVIFSSNDAQWGSGMSNNSSHPTLFNVSFSGNRAHLGGGGMLNSNSNPILTNVSFSGNHATDEGGGMLNYVASSPVIRNSIFWHNRDGSGTGTASASVYSLDQFIPHVSYSLVQGCNPEGNWNGSCGTDGGSNLTDASPLFIDTPDPLTAPTTAGNLRLMADSPAIDAGNDDFVVGISTDLDGNPRIIGQAVDLGPFEVFPEFEVTAVTGNGQGSISPATQQVLSGYDASFEVSPAEGWMVNLIGDTCTPIQLDGTTWIAENITEDCTVTADFKRISLFHDRFEGAP